ncbi:Flp family type IVb pilin [Novosphingobium sp.]|uniref:Flp family type IVb pilin n=1 Tax=Novosphingobium sp. TaxID=1874826 RepID=UPI002736F349|nr:Flp family type IVb pilin [Novosphingobium sp.]MDP3905612.1 Flp family type IVb pilin [Novosphingobium sp.]
MLAIIKRLFADKAGTSALEYGLICALIVIAMVGAFNGFSNETQSMWAEVASKQKAASQKASAN